MYLVFRASTAETTLKQFETAEEVIAAYEPDVFTYLSDKGEIYLNRDSSILVIKGKIQIPVADRYTLRDRRK
jgi:hypothetical protein